MSWIIGLGYLAGLIACARWIAPRLLDSMEPANPDTAVTVISRMIALTASIFWPIILLGALVMWRAPKSDGQLKQELKSRNERIRQLERELGIGTKEGT